MADEKRFKIAKGVPSDLYAYILDNGEKMYLDEVVELLNSLVEENEQLRIQNELLSEQNREYKALFEKKYGKYLKEKFKRNDE